MRLKVIPVLAALLLSGCTPVQTVVNPAQLPPATDFGAHANPMEWWYVSAYLPAEGLALHWAQFRVQDSRVPVPLMISHVAVTDLRTGQVTFLEQPAGTGEVTSPPLRVRQGAWTLTQAGPEPTAPLSLKAGPLDLTLTPVKGPVLHPPGYSGSADTGVLFYQGITRLDLTGTVNGRALRGQAWLDHQWGNHTDCRLFRQQSGTSPPRPAPRPKGRFSASLRNSSPSRIRSDRAGFAAHSTQVRMTFRIWVAERVGGWWAVVAWVTIIDPQ